MDTAGAVQRCTDGINDKEIWTKKCENGQIMYQTYQFVESHTEKSITIDKALQKYKSTKDNHQFKQIVQSLMGDSNKVHSSRKVLNRAQNAHEDWWRT